MSWPTCPVCGLPHRPARTTNGGPGRCYHCGNTGRRCRCPRRRRRWHESVEALPWWRRWLHKLRYGLVTVLGIPQQKGSTQSFGYIPSDKATA